MVYFYLYFQIYFYISEEIEVRVSQELLWNTIADKGYFLHTLKFLLKSGTVISGSLKT